VTTDLAEGAAAWLLTYSVHSTVLLSLAWLIHRTRRLDPATADVCWKVALVGGLLTASLQPMLDHRPAGTLSLGAVPAVVSLDPIDQPLLQRNNQSRFTSEPGRNDRPAIVTPSVPATGLSPSAIAIFAWLGIAGLLVIAYAARRLILVGRLGDRRPVIDERMRALLIELQHNGDARVQLTTSTAISSPVALGRSEICLPSAALLELEPEQQRAMLAHELAHLERLDPLWLTLACVIERVFFFQPLNRMARRQMQESAEYLCDEIAAQRSGGVPLARCLVKVAEWLQASPLGVPMAGMAEQPSQLAARVARLLDSGKRSTRRSRTVMVTASAVVLLGTVAVIPGFAGQSLPAVTSNQSGNYGVSELPTVEAESVRSPMAVDASDESDSNTTESNFTESSVIERIPSDANPVLAIKNDTSVVRALMARLRDDNSEVRAAAARALGRIAEPMAIPALIAALDDSDKDVRRAAVSALGHFEREVPAAPLRKMLESEDAEIRHEVAHLLGNLEDDESIPALAGLTLDLNLDVRIAAIEALANIGARTAVDALRARLVDLNEEVRLAALEALDHLEIRVDEKIILQGLEDVNADFRYRSIQFAAHQQLANAVPVLIRMLNDPNGEVREGAAEALTEIRTDAARAALKVALDHKDANVRRIAVEFLGEDRDQ
jgi:HEAT repeat protein/beta-lactamase regulating signal transducer with metallopeptidase domain